MGLSDGNEWMDLNSIDIHEWFEESPPLKKKLCLLLKNKKASATRSFEESTKPLQSDEQSKFVLPVTRSENESERVVQPKKSNHCFPLKSEKPETSKVLKDSINTSPTVEQSRRFALPVSESELEKAACGVVPANTQFNTQWAERNFTAWAIQRNAIASDDPVPLDLLSSHDPVLVSKHLRRFVMETRSTNGEPYPPATLRSLLSGINRILKANKAPFSIFNKEDPVFRNLMLTMDSLSSDLHSKGIGAQRRSTEIITIEDEDLFWAKGSLGSESPQMLQHTVFFYIGLQFCLRGVQEQYELSPSQLIRYPPDMTVYNEEVYYQYTEFISKNNQHRFKDTNISNKQVRSYAFPGNNRCLVKLLDCYLSKLPPNSSYLYMRPLPAFPDDLSRPSYTKQRVGINSIKQFLPRICDACGLGRKYTNHSLRATAITRMFEGKIPEKVIADKSGHKSIQGLRCYERISVKQDQAAGELINGINKPVIENELKSDSDTTAHSSKENGCKGSTSATAGHAQTFTGTLNNCTINIMYK